jgi:hypothetical protein
MTNELTVEQLLSTEPAPADPVPPVPEPSPEPEPVKKDVLNPPTVGRTVWVKVAGESNEIQPRMGQIAFVHDDRCVNLSVTEHSGVQSPAIGVQLAHEGDLVTDGTLYCYWMSYQINQAKESA